MSPGRPTPTLGERIRERRVNKDLGLREFARLAKITPSYLSDIENDRRTPAEDVMRTIAKELELRFDELMGLAGRLNDETEEYLRREPTAAVLFRRISERKLKEDELRRLLKQTEDMRKRSRS